MTGALLEIEELAVTYGQARAVDGVTLSLGAGEIVSVVGANGAGKTTLVRAVTGILRPASGTIRFGGKDITGWDAADICELGLAQVPEGRQIFPTLSVEENLDLGATLKRARARKAETRDRVFTMFPRLAERRRQRADTLSGGEQQMLAIGRCLMALPQCILFDEPSLGLSPLLAGFVFETVETLRKQGMSVLLVEQNVIESLSICDRAYVMENGRIPIAGSGAELLADDRVRQAYLGV